MTSVFGDDKGQGSFEYILLVGGAILFVLIVIAILRSGFFTPAANQTNQSTTAYYNYLNETRGQFTGNRSFP